MTYASDKLKNGFIRRNRSRIANEVKALEILLHLPCLTTTDMEEVEAAFRRMGNTYAMSQLLDNLTRRENWPEEFIRALEECEHPTLAQEMSDAYEALKQPKQRQKPVAPSAGPAVVTSAHVLTPSSIAAHPPVHPSAPSIPSQQIAQSAPSPQYLLNLPPSPQYLLNLPPSPQYLLNLPPSPHYLKGLHSLPVGPQSVHTLLMCLLSLSSTRTPVTSQLSIPMWLPVLHPPLVWY
ncbi:mitochondrial antiviral-signaling protein-like [Alosa alosa]|uniref:mitochondrial antiviral-signaling protein-like n=1 Tax=Alosa alosa TaxID=278164 RepID=UPI00201522F7|nr:mitochondrial antiviral-signaling protein-like [Alosa alosa]